MTPLLAEDPLVVGGYEIVARVGVGGMGIVYLARSPGGRRAALKVVRAEIADDPEFRDRFRREIGAARQVGGAFTAPVLDADPDAAQPWLATVFVDGPSLRDQVAEAGPLSERRARQLGAGLAEALRDMHRVGLVHRDVKPGNVLLAADGPRLIDFGIIRSDALADLTASGYVLGSAGFMAPEQAEGLHTGPGADVFALGAVLTFATTGVGPFGSGSAATLLVRTVEGRSDLSRVPDGLREVVARCLAPDPADRPSDGDLLALLAGPAAAAPIPRHWPGTSANPEPEPVPKPEPAPRPKPRPRTRPEADWKPAPPPPVDPEGYAKPRSPAYRDSHTVVRSPAGRAVSRRKVLAPVLLAVLGSTVAAVLRANQSRSGHGSAGTSAPSPSLGKTPLWEKTADARVASADGAILRFATAQGSNPNTLFLVGRGLGALDPSTGASRWSVDGTLLDTAAITDTSVGISMTGAPAVMTPGSLIELSATDGSLTSRRGITPVTGDRIAGVVGNLYICDLGHAGQSYGGPPKVVGLPPDGSTPVWSVSPDAVKASYAVAVSPGGQVAVADFGGRTLTLYRGYDGRRVWQVGLSADAVSPSVAFSGQDVVHGGRTVRRLAYSDGSVQWESSRVGVPTDEEYRILGLDGERVYVTTAEAGATQATILALDLNYGSSLWASDPVPIDLACATPLVAAAQTVVVTDRGLNLTALNAAGGGTVRWHRASGATAETPAGLATDSVRVFWAAGGKVLAFAL